MRQPVRILVVDDSTFTRKAIMRMLQADPALVVVGQARDGEEAIALAEELRPDVVTLDLEMPGLSGLETLARLRRDRHVPVVVLSGAASGNVTLQALDHGAFDVVAKPGGGHLAIHGVAAELVDKVRAAAGLPLRRMGSGPLPPVASLPRHEAREGRLVVIGISTGGPPALQALIPALPADFPAPILVLQHMPPGYTRALAERLDHAAAIAVKEAAEGDALLPGRVLVAPSGFQTTFKRTLNGPRIALHEDCPFPTFYRPCVDYTFMEAARCFGAGVLAVVMTGMGADGAEGLRAVKGAGGHGWAQDEATSTIYGMPRAAAETGVLDAVYPLGAIADRLAHWAGSPAPGRR